MNAVDGGPKDEGAPAVEYTLNQGQNRVLIYVWLLLPLPEKEKKYEGFALLHTLQLLVDLFMH